MSAVRSLVAVTVLRHQDPLPRDIETILDHLEGVALHANRGNLDPDLVWGDFGSAILCYWHTLSGYVVRQRSVRMDRTLYWELERLQKKIRAEDIKRRELAPGRKAAN